MDKKQKNYCPFIRGKCRKDCVLYRSGLRYFDDEKKPVAFEECAINIMADCMENMVTRSIGQQKATEEMRNEFGGFNQFLSLAVKKSLEKKT